MRRSHLFLGVALLALLCAVIVWWVTNTSPTRQEGRRSASTPDRSREPAVDAPSAEPPSQRLPAGLGSPSQVAWKPAPAPPGLPVEPVIPISRQILAKESSPQRDLEVVFELLEIYKRTFKGYPAGQENRHFVNALTGNNPQRAVLIAPTHPAISAEGELIDRWGTPVFFHLVASDQIELRSAGPDREMYSPDDLELQSPSLRALSRAAGP